MSNEGTKHDAGKPDLALIPAEQLARASPVFDLFYPVPLRNRQARPALCDLAMMWQWFLVASQRAEYPGCLLVDTVRVLEAAIPKYGRHNWGKGLAWLRVDAAIRRHLVLGCAPSDMTDEGRLIHLSLDPEFGLPHLAHASAGVMMLSHYAELGLGTDDIWGEAC